MKIDRQCDVRCCSTCEYYTGSRTRKPGLHSSTKDGDLWGYVSADGEYQDRCEIGEQSFAIKGACSHYKTWKQLFKQI